MELELDRLTKQYGPKIAVDRVSARLGAGVYGLLGANGAGKTTIMRMICGILRPTSGEVRLDGRPTAEMGGEFRARLGYLPQDFGYYPEFTALDFMEYMAALKGLDSRGARTRSLELLDRVGLAGEERRLIRTFSGGMKQRLGIAQAMLNDPDVLVLDEPTAGLDPKERVRFRNLIASFAADKVVLLSTHIVSDVECIADSILMMRAGSLIMRGAPSEVVSRVDGMVWEARVPAREADELSTASRVVNVHHMGDGTALVRFLSGDGPSRVPGAVRAEPTLEDLYLHVFDESGAEAYDEATRLELYDPYYITLLKPWAVRGLEPYQYAFRVTPEMALDFYGALAASLQDSLDEGMGGEWVYSPAERVFWTEKEAGVAEPIGYGWSGGWDNILDCTAFLVFAIFAACVTVTPLFASEYREGTDAVLLSSLNGRGRLVAAKLAAAALYATALFAAGAAIVCGVSLAFYGAGGADLTIQNYALASPYNLTMAQAAALYIGIFYLVMLGMLALTLALSASTSSTLAIIVTDVVVLFVTGLLPSAGVGVLRHILTLFPMGLQSPFDIFAALFSYPVGPVVLDLIGMAALVYGALVAVGVPLALGRWCRHQVA